MTENDLKAVLAKYQQKSFDLFSQVVALEARVSSSNQLIESLSNKINDLTIELESLKAKNKKTDTKITDNSEEF